MDLPEVDAIGVPIPPVPARGIEVPHSVMTPANKPIIGDLELSDERIQPDDNHHATHHNSSDRTQKHGVC